MLLLTAGSAISLVLAPLSLPPRSESAPPVLQSRLGARPPGLRDVLTQHNDNARSGAYLVERHLTPQTVRSGRFQRLYARRVDGDILAQPLYAHDVDIPRRGVKNLVFVATAKNWLYAFDADEPSTDPGAGVAWSVSLGPSRQLRRPTCTTPGSTDCDTRDGGEICAETYNGFVGVTSTPVIDRETDTLYVVARVSTRKDDPADGLNYLYAINIANGSFRRPPRRIEAVDRASGDVLDTHCARNRPGLLLLHGVVYVAFGALNCDGFCPLTKKPYHGWVLGYRTTDLAQVAVFDTSPGGGGAGVWQSGGGLVGLPDGTIFLETGNEYINCADPRFQTEAYKRQYFDKCSPVNSPLGDSFVKLRATGAPPGLILAGWFRPNNAVELRDADVDLGAGGPLALPGGTLIGGGKQGRYYVLNTSTMRLVQNAHGAGWPVDGFQAFFNTWHSDPQQPDCPYNQTVDHCYVDPAAYGRAERFGPNIHGGPVYWERPRLGYGLIYQMAEKDFLKAFTYDLRARRVSEQARMTARRRPPDGMPGGFSSLSADGDANGILWTSLATGDAQWTNQGGILAAFDATTLAELWSDPPTDGTTQPAPSPTRGPDDVLFAKFTPPTIADGRVYRATYSNQLVVYGLRPPK
jgi:hypothetical protein